MTSQPSKTVLKQQLRQTFLEQRNLRPEQDIVSAARAIEKTGLEFIDNRADKIVSGYHPKGKEFDCLKLLQRLQNEGHPIALPVVAAKAQPLVFRQWRIGDPLEQASFGILVPPPDCNEVEPDILLVPLLAFDLDGYRLGYGGGFYDRTLEKLRKKKQIAAIGIAFDDQEMDSAPHDHCDQPLDWILSPSGFLKIERRAG